MLLPTGDKSLRIRVGCHTGCVVAGIVGIKVIDENALT